ncbi:hypothetical protein H8S90_05140 [Olivibacter sp. SDN3]|uniref:hypothetical protein n=1 Tax=Olivibacter sp. SDN3 TaxID=2764720 RepID=UPI0016511450|nr:hypothetical protein [Olivibacter sp. SDN3]QNL50976.1 hypothetical protein H8S90_05140 [Olivibacter sp. SDN3]
MGFIIFFRILFVVCMVFVIGYIFGGFAKNRALSAISKTAAILAIVLFILTNIFLTRFAFSHMQRQDAGDRCWFHNEKNSIERTK